METIGDRIRKRRIELGMSQEELATKIGYKDRSSINKIEKDGRNLRQGKILAIANALFTTTDYIMGWGDDVGDKDAVFAAYVSDPEIRRLIMHAGANIPKDNVTEYVDALINTINTLNSLSKK